MITDATLCYMEKTSKYQQYRILKNLAKLSVDAIEMTASVWQNLADMVLPPCKYVLRVKDKTDIYNFKGFHRYVIAQKDDSADNVFIRQKILSAQGKCIGVRIKGCTTLSVPDMQKQFAEWKKKKKQVSFEPLDYLNQAAALAAGWLLNDGYGVVTAFCGLASHAPLEEVLLTLHLLGIKQLQGKLDFSELKTIMEQENIIIPANKPVIGASIFAVESGIHVDGILKNPHLYEPYPPELVNSKRHIILGDSSGKSAVEAKMRELQINYHQVNMTDILEKVKRKSRSLCRSITDKEFCELLGIGGNKKPCLR
ncbi:homocitrate synthase/isopropylmalate synthase family protein [Pectinatus sottacetonis]|uniref:homocitrate synthase/isopropylmalate synthase family protein n=1 Tax=Pectinatus sottacetonis TaxID=1002795 RepID=UPI0018C837E9|nr:hypothetical protein [Pectinatus sottacetonis]